MTKYKTVQDYYESIPEKDLNFLKKIEKAVYEVAPKAQFVISYSMPCFKEDGYLLYMASFSKHMSIFVPMADYSLFKKELSKFKTSKATIQFTHENPIPMSLVKKLVKNAKLNWKSKIDAKKRKSSKKS